MVTKRKRGQKQVKVGKLKLNKETVKDLTSRDARKIKGGGVVAAPDKMKSHNCLTDNCRNL